MNIWAEWNLCILQCVHARRTEPWKELQYTDIRISTINRNQSYRTRSTFLPKTSWYNCSRSTVISRPTESVAASRQSAAGDDLVENGVVVAFIGILARIAAFFVVPEMVVERRLGVWFCGIPFAEELIAICGWRRIRSNSSLKSARAKRLIVSRK